MELSKREHPEREHSQKLIPITEIKKKYDRIEIATYEDGPELVEVFKNVPKCSKMFQNLQKCSQVCKGVQQCSKVFKAFQNIQKLMYPCCYPATLHSTSSCTSNLVASLV